MNKYIDFTNWIDRLPSPLQPYLRLMRLDKPIGTWLLLLPCWWSVALAADKYPNLLYLFLFAVGAVVMRAAGCIVNDLYDRNLDSKVARTATRPLASGEIEIWQAVVLLIVLLLIGFGVLVSFNDLTIWVGASSLLLVAIYPAMKRITWWPQLILGFTFNWGALLGWTAVHDFIGLPTIPLYIAGIFWTLGYDTIYAQQDVLDDARVGIKSSALLLGDAVLPWVALFYAIAVLFLMLAGVSANLGKSYYVVLTLAAVFIAVQLTLWRRDDPDNCLNRFCANRDFGLMIFAAIILGKYF